GLYYKFAGFRDQDVASLTNFFQNNCGITPEEKQLSVSGHNWGEVDLNGWNMLTFVTGSKQAFEVSLADVSQTQLQGKNDVIMEFHVDDTTGANEGCVFTYDAVGSYEKVGYSSQGSGSTLIMPFLDNQLKSPSSLLLPAQPNGERELIVGDEFLVQCSSFTRYPGHVYGG
ncbi:hypothetical protein J1N35_011706, partial [Gossypium stocksii]